MNTDIWFMEIRNADDWQTIVKEWLFFGTEQEAIVQAEKALRFSLKTAKQAQLVVVTECDEYGNPCGDTAYQGDFGLCP
jgi:hypothetical protein